MKRGLSDDKMKACMVEALHMFDSGEGITTVREECKKRFGSLVQHERLFVLKHTRSIEQALVRGEPLLQHYRKLRDEFGLKRGYPDRSLVPRTPSPAPRPTRVEQGKSDPIEDLLTKLLQLMRERQVTRIALDDSGKITVEKREVYSL